MTYCCEDSNILFIFSIRTILNFEYECFNFSTEVKIPRAHPVYPLAAESASVASDTIPSDYPSETPSEAEQVHTNQAFILEDSYHSEGKKLRIN